MSDKIKELVKKLEPELIKTRRDLHKYAEAGWTEFRTSSKAINVMKSLGYKITMGDDAIDKKLIMGAPNMQELETHMKRAVAQGADETTVNKMRGSSTAFWADMVFTAGDPKIALRFDMDSNDANESKDLTHRPAKEGFASINDGAMHACGHDGHVSIALAVAEIVANMKEELKGSVRFIFQPAEEGLRGAAPMISAGCVKDVDFIMGMHIGFQASKKGDLVCGAKGFLASTKYDVTFTGKSAHAGAAPEEGKNALLASAVAALNLHAISRHSGGTTRINVGKIVAGEGRNVVPPSALLVMETRGLTSELNDYMVEESDRILKAAAMMWGCEYHADVVGGTQSGESSEAMINDIYEVAKTMPCFTNIIKLRDFGAGEDYAHMMSEVQKNGGIGSYMQIGMDKTAGHHNNKFDFDETVLSESAELVTRLVFKYLKK